MKAPDHIKVNTKHRVCWRDPDDTFRDVITEHAQKSPEISSVTGSRSMS